MYCKCFKGVLPAASAIKALCRVYGVAMEALSYFLLSEFKSSVTLKLNDLGRLSLTRSAYHLCSDPGPSLHAFGMLTDLSHHNRIDAVVLPPHMFLRPLDLKLWRSSGCTRMSIGKIFGFMENLLARKFVRGRDLIIFNQSWWRLFSCCILPTSGGKILACYASRVRRCH